MRAIDISLPVSERMLVWEGDPPVRVSPAKRIARGDPSNVSELTMGSHTGTHVDAPAHFIDGAPGVDEIPLEALVGEAVVVDLRDAGMRIGAAHIPAGAERVLLKTNNSSLWRDADAVLPGDYACLSLEGARACVERGVRLVGTDFLSIEEAGASGHPVHVELLRAGVVILEGLDLSEVEPGSYTLVGLPMKVVGADGAPARAVLLR